MLVQIVAMVSGISPVPVFARTGLAAAAGVAGSGQAIQTRIADGGAGARATGLRAPASARPVEPVENTAKSAKANDQKLSKEEERSVQELKRRDSEVRAHERAHATTGGDLTGSPSFEFTQGPDGKRYATGGEVSIDSGPVRGNPAATVRKMDTVIRAALAPASPSSQDQQVARQAQQARTQAQAELTDKRLAENQGDGGETAPGSESATSDAPAAARQLQARSAYGQSATGGEEDIATQIFAAANALSVFA